MKRAIEGVLARPIGVLVASFALAAMGILSFIGIPLQLLPDGFEARFLTVRAALREMSAEEAEQQVAIPIEESLATVAGIEAISSRSDRGDVRVLVELKKDADPATVERDVRDRMARVEADLPEDVDRLWVRREGMNDRPVLFFACMADVEDPLVLSDFMEDRLQPRLESVGGVARVQSWGLLTRSVRIWLDQEEVARRRLDLRRLLDRLRGDNLASDLGDVRTEGKKAFVRATMDFGSLDEIRAFPVAEGLTLGEIARVEIAPSVDMGLSRYNGSAVVVGTAYKMAGANTVETCRRVRETLDAITKEGALKGLEFRPFFDEGEMIETSIGTLYSNSFYGGLLAIAVLYAFFRRVRMTLLVTAALPLSLMIAITCLYLAKDSLNLATMMGLTLAVGMLVDNAIVVVEAILRRRETGELARTAATEGTKEVALAVITSTLTTMVVVLPFIFLSEDSDARLWLASIGMPISYALLASLAVALVLVPLGSVYLRRRDDARASPEALPALGHRMTQGLPLLHMKGGYARVLSWSLRHRFATVLLGILLCASAAFPFAKLGQKAAMGRGHGPVRVQLRWPRHFTLADADRAARQYEAFVAGLKEELEIDGIYTRFDRYGGMAMVWQVRDATVDAAKVEERVREGWPRIPGIWTSLEAAGGGLTTVTLEGEDPRALDRTIDAIEARLKRLPSVAETRRERATNLEELRINVDPEAVERGLVSPDLIRGMVGWVVRGARLRDYQARGHDLPLLLELDPEQAVEVRDLGEVLIPTVAGLRPLSSLTKTGVHHSPIAIERRDGRRVAELEVKGREKDDRAFTDEVQGLLAAFELPPGVRFQVTGSWRELQETFRTLFHAMLLACTLVFLLTGVLFEAILLPLAVLVAIPPAIAGGIWGLYVSGKPMDELSFLGGILLVGVVVNNGIVLIDRAQQRRREGLPLRAAIAAAGSDRLRPVLMTATTTVVGLIPMAVFKAQGEEIPYDTLATVVIGGLTVSTIVTLLLVPVCYSLFADLGRTMWRGVRGLLASKGGGTGEGRERL